MLVNPINFDFRILSLLNLDVNSAVREYGEVLCCIVIRAESIYLEVVVFVDFPISIDIYQKLIVLIVVLAGKDWEAVHMV